MIALALQAATAFNLICIGTVTEVPTELGSAIDAGSFRVLYRIDLELGLYCKDECSSTEAIESVTDTEIRFWSASYRATGDGGFESVDRETGAYRDVRLRDPLSSHRNGSCERAPFSGFPALPATVP